MYWFSFRKKKLCYKMLRCLFWKHPAFLWYTPSCQSEGGRGAISVITVFLNFCVDSPATADFKLL